MFSGSQLVVLVIVGLLGHIMAIFWFWAVSRRWHIASRTIYSLDIPREQIARELRNSWHAPVHSVLLAAFLAIGCFQATDVWSFAYTAAITTVWAELWHYGSHRAFHLPALHWIHREHHKSHINSWLTAI